MSSKMKVASQHWTDWTDLSDWTDWTDLNDWTDLTDLTDLTDWTIDINRKI